METFKIDYTFWQDNRLYSFVCHAECQWNDGSFYYSYGDINAMQKDWGVEVEDIEYELDSSYNLEDLNLILAYMNKHQHLIKNTIGLEYSKKNPITSI